MKKLLLFFFFSCLVSEVLASAIVSQKQWRWRNDNGNETNATWKGDLNNPLTVSASSREKVRLRIAFSTAPHPTASDPLIRDVNEILSYATSPDGTFTPLPVGSTTTAPFVLVSSSQVAAGTPTSRQLNSGPEPFVPGAILVRDPSEGGFYHFSTTSGTTSVTELEWVLQPTAYVQPGTYYFRLEEIGGTWDALPSITVEPATIQGPAQVNNGIMLWLDASDVDGDGNLTNNPASGSALTVWKDKTGLGNDATVVAGKNAGVFYANQINGNPVVRFNRIDNFNGSMYVANGVDLRAGTNPDVTIFTVYKQGNRGTSPQEAIWGIDNGAWDRFFFTHRGSDDGGVSLGPTSEIAVVPGSGKVGELRLLTAVYDGTVSGTSNSGPVNESVIYFNGKVIRRFTDSTHPTDAQTALNIGRDGDDNVFNGDLAEMLVYNRKLTDCEIEEINYYLSQKYGVDFTNIAANYSLPAPHNNDINGIGKLNTLCNIPAIETSSSGILTISNPSANNTAGSFITLGNDRGGYSADTETPPAFVSRLKQEWRVDVDGNLGTVDLTFDLTGLGLSLADANDFALLVDTDGNFSDAQVLMSGRTITGNKITFTGLSLTHGQYLTIATQAREFNKIAGTTASKKSGFFTATTIDDQVTVTGTQNITDARVYIESGFQPGDNISVAGTLPAGITASYNANTGALTFTGTATSAQWQEVFRTVQFNTNSTNTGDRTFKFLLGNAVSLNMSGKPHYYQFVTTPLSWVNAKTAAAGKTLFGLSGYLATITSQQENDFVKDKLSGDGWVGGSDEYTQVNGALGTAAFASQTAVEGRWHWITGPEKGTPISTGNQNAQAVNGAFINWASGEPNNSNGEHFMQLYSADLGRWNDLPASMSLGYLVEFGGYSNDPVLEIEHARTLNYYKMPTPATPVLVNDNNGYTNTNLPTVAGTSLAGAEVTVYLDGSAVGTTAVDAGGNWTYTFVTPLAEGAHRVTVSAKDADNFVSDPSQALSFIVDTQAPVAPEKPVLAASNNGYTNDNTPTISGTAEANAVLTVYQDGQTLGTVAVAADGTWSYTFAAALADGARNVEVTATDAAGNVSGKSQALVINVDTQSPASPAAPVLAEGFTNPTNNNKPAVTGSAEPGADVTVYLNGIAVASVTADAQGTWSYAFTQALADGTHAIVAAAADAAGNVSQKSESLSLVVDRIAPTVTLASSQANPAKEAFDVIITFSEKVTGFGQRAISLTNANVAELTTTDNITYTAKIIPIADGEVEISVLAGALTDMAGNNNEASNTYSITYDGTKPTVALSAAAPDLVTAFFQVTVKFSEDVSGFDAADITVNNGTATLLPVSGQEFTATITPATEGVVSVAVAADVAQDGAGNGNQASAVLTRNYDVTKPTVVLATTAPDAVNAAYAITLTFSEPVADFQLTDLMVNNGTASDLQAMSATVYTVKITPAAQGAVSVVVAAEVAQDAAGNVNTASNQLSRIHDSVAPSGYAVTFNQTPIDFSNQANASVQVSGAEVGAAYSYTITSAGGGTPVAGTGTVAAATFDIAGLNLSGLAEGQLTLTLTLRDAAANTGVPATATAIKYTRNIVAITALPTLRVPIRTSFAAVGLPATVEVTYSDNTKQNVAVIWQPGAYNGAVAGTYELAGTLTLAPGTTNLAQVEAKMTVVVEPNKVPVALTISKTSFSPDIAGTDEATPEAIGTFATTDEDDNQHTYTLVSGVGSTDNNLFEISGNALFLKSNKGLSGPTSFAIRVRSTDAYQNAIEQTFTLTKQAYAKAPAELKIVNTFSPDGNGRNDTWVIPELRFYNNVEVEVFDRAGQRLFRSTDPEMHWDGRALNGLELKGAFLYLVRIHDINLVKKGVVTILRK
jgi:large repetitive protein